MLQKCIVFLPVYNGSKFITQTIESVLNQDYQNFELIITDDCSSDNSITILGQYRDKYPQKVKLIRNEKNLGVGATLYNSYKKYGAGAGYFAMIGHDDIWAPNFLSSQIKQLNDNNAIVTFAKVNFIDGNGEKIKNDTLFFHKNLKKMDGQKIFIQLISRNFLCAPSSVVNLHLCDFKEVKTFWGYNNDTLQDYEMWLNLCLRGKFIYNDATSICYRIHNNNLSNESKYILFSKLEYYSTLQRVFFSNGFWQFLNRCEDKYYFIDKIIENLKVNLSYSNPCKLLLLDLCSNLLNRGYEDNLIKDTFYYLYMDSGILTKCLKEGRHLPRRISIVQCGEIKNKRIVDYLKDNSEFYFESGIDKIKHFSMCLIQMESLEFLINNESFFRNLLNNQVVVVGNANVEKNEIKKKFPNLLFIDDDIQEGSITQTILSYMEDHTHIYRNGFFDMLTAYHVPDLKTDVAKIEFCEEEVRRIEYIEYIPKNVEYSSGKRKLNIASMGQVETLFEKNRIYDKTLELRSDGQFDVRMRILVNNKLYLCTDVGMGEAGLELLYKPVSYFNNATRANQFTSFNISDILAQYYELSVSYYAIINSTFYRWYKKIWKVIRKFRLEKVTLKILGVIKTVYGKIFIG